MHEALGTVVVTMLWFYVTTTAILVGAEVDAVRTGEAASTSRPVERDTR